MEDKEEKNWGVVLLAKVMETLFVRCVGGW